MKKIILLFCVLCVNIIICILQFWWLQWFFPEPYKDFLIYPDSFTKIPISNFYQISTRTSSHPEYFFTEAFCQIPQARLEKVVSWEVLYSPIILYESEVGKSIVPLAAFPWAQEICIEDGFHFISLLLKGKEKQFIVHATKESEMFQCTQKKSPIEKFFFHMYQNESEGSVFENIIVDKEYYIIHPPVGWNDTDIQDFILSIPECETNM